MVADGDCELLDFAETAAEVCAIIRRRRQVRRVGNQGVRERGTGGKGEGGGRNDPLSTVHKRLTAWKRSRAWTRLKLSATIASP